MGPLGKLVRPARDWLDRRGVRTVFHKNRGQAGFAGFTASWREDDASSLLRCALTTVPFDGGAARFLIVNEDDLVQRELAGGRFYEIEELNIIRRHFRGGTFVDFGANIGNHAVFAGLVLGADRLVVVEPNPVSARLLEHNVALNNLGQRTRLLRYGVSDRPGRTEIDTIPLANLGGARLRTVDDRGSIALTTGDDLLRDEQPTFIKIDTEGFELRVLRGLVETLARHRPTVFVEVEDANIDEAQAMLIDKGYTLRERFKRYPGVTNFLFVADTA